MRGSGLMSISTSTKSQNAIKCDDSVAYMWFCPWCNDSFNEFSLLEQHVEKCHQVDLESEQLKAVIAAVNLIVHYVED
jgi:hypothetical protein